MGVPQGTVLGPILFLIYINNLFSLDVGAQFVSYADDTVLLFKDSNWEKVNKKASIGLSTVRMWFDKYLLTLNYKKTKYVAFSISGAGENHIKHMTLHNNICVKNNNHNCQCNIKIQAVSQFKYLGIIVDEHLRWDQHIQYITSKIRSLITIFYRLRNLLNKDLLVNIYKALAESILRYAIIIWGGTFDTILSKLCSSQNYIIEVILKKNMSYSTERLYNETKLFNINQIYILQSVIFIHTKYKKQPVQHAYSTRLITENKIEENAYKKISLSKICIVFRAKILQYYSELN